MPINQANPFTNKIAQPYTPAYKEACFFQWYNAGKPSIRSFALEIITPDEYGNKPHWETLKDWTNVYEWDKRAAILDAQVMRQIETQAVEERVKMLRRHADVGRQLVEAGLKRIETIIENEGKFEKDADAIRAIIQGAELERTSLGLPTAMLDVANMKDEQLSDVINKLLGRVSVDDAQKIVEGTIIENASDDTEA